MARVFTAKANKDYPQHGIVKGDTYYYWTPGFRGTKQMSKTPPKQSQLTTSKMSAAYAASESLSEALEAAGSIEDLTNALEEAVDAIRAVAEEYTEASEATTGNGNRVPNADEMEEKAQELNDWADSIESDKSEVEGLDASDYVDSETAITDLPEELVEDCETCGAHTKRKDVEGFDDLTEEEQGEMLEAARTAAQQNVDCPV